MELNLITDRTQADADLVVALAAKGFDNMTAEERASWLAGLKGAYNSADLSRVDNAVQAIAVQAIDLIAEIKTKLNTSGVASDKAFSAPYKETDVSVNAPQEWPDGLIPAAEQLDAYLHNIYVLRSLIPSDAPSLPESMERLNITGANNIEKTLVCVESALAAYLERMLDKIDRTAASWNFSGELYAGEV